MFPLNLSFGLPKPRPSLGFIDFILFLPLLSAEILFVIGDLPTAFTNSPIRIVVSIYSLTFEDLSDW